MPAPHHIPAERPIVDAWRRIAEHFDMVTARGPGAGVLGSASLAVHRIGVRMLRAPEPTLLSLQPLYATLEPPSETGVYPPPATPPQAVALVRERLPGSSVQLWRLRMGVHGNGRPVWDCPDTGLDWSVIVTAAAVWAGNQRYLLVISPHCLSNLAE